MRAGRDGHRGRAAAAQTRWTAAAGALELTQRDLADAIDVPYQRVNELVNARRGVTPSTALRLAKFFGTTPGFWLNFQLRWDLYHAQQEEADALKKIRRRPRSRSSTSAV